MVLDLKRVVIIFHAGSLSRPLEAMADSFRVRHPGIRDPFLSSAKAGAKVLYTASLGLENHTDFEI